MTTRNDPDNRDGVLGALARFGRGRVAAPPRPPERAAIPPSRRNRKALTTWQDSEALKHLKQLATELETSQQALIAEGINHVLSRHGKPVVAT
jgi:hypothetical protein